MLQVQSIHTLTLHDFVKRKALIVWQFAVWKWKYGLLRNSTAQRTAGTQYLPYKAKLKLTTEEIQYMLQAIYHISPVFLPYH
jgi:hypothetical protein